MGDWLDYVLMGIITVAVWLVTAVIVVVCLGFPLYLTMAHHDPHFLLLYVISLPVLGAVAGTILWIQDN
jgi:ABC-type Na+ efflux pump permease subunit